MSNYLPLVVPGLLLLAGAALVFDGSRDIYFGFRAFGWRPVRGRVVALSTHAGSPARGDSVAVVTYEYSVDGIRYRSSRFDYAGANGGSGAGAILLEASVGARVVVLVDPARPARAVLAPGASMWSLVSVGIGVLILGAVLTAIFG